MEGTDITTAMIGKRLALAAIMGMTLI